VTDAEWEAWACGGSTETDTAMDRRVVEMVEGRPSMARERRKRIQRASRTRGFALNNLDEATLCKMWRLWLAAEESWAAQRAETYWFGVQPNCGT
jgi:hypothetical protein